MRVTLVTPPSPYLINDKSLPWLGPLWVAACLRQRGHEVSILDLAGNPNYLQSAAMHAETIGADVYGLTATAPDYPLARQILSSIRLMRPKSRVILGGAHATTSPASCLQDGWDAVVSGDGFVASERALTENGLISASKRGEIVEDIDTLPFPARDLVDLDSYHFRVCGERFTSVMTAFGCPMGCTFCCGRDLYVYRKLRAMRPKRVLAEWDAIRVDYPQFRGIMDYSDEWNIPAARAVELAEAIAAHPTKWMIRCFIKAEHFTPDVASAMARAGVVEVLTGVESGSDRILKVIKKNTSWEINGRARILAMAHGIRFKAATMVGHPTETREDALLTKQWLLTFRPDEFDVTVFQPMLGSPIADRPDREGRGLFFDTPDGNVRPYKTIPGQYEAMVRTETLSAADLVSLRDEIDRDVREALGMKPLQRDHPYEASMGQVPVLSGL